MRYGDAAFDELALDVVAGDGFGVDGDEGLSVA